MSSGLKIIYYSQFRLKCRWKEILRLSSNERMCIIGFGRMGKRAAHIFSKRFTVKIISSRDVAEEAITTGATLADNPDEEISMAGFIFLAIPVNVINLWVTPINNFSPPDCVVIDCCTARTAAEKELSKLQRARFAIPELGPGVTPVIGTPDKRIADFLKNQGCILRPETPEEYDKNNVDAGIAQFLGIALDLFLDDSQLGHLKKSASGPFLLKLIEQMKSNSPTTYRENQTMNPYMAEARNKLITALQNVDKELNSGIFRFESYPQDRWRS
jgi:prephenate dehydrogenase